MTYTGPTPNQTADNGMLRCYNMVPDNFRDIAEMTAYLDTVAKLGMNVVWINPIQLAGNTPIEKSDALTGQQQILKGSVYAMAHATLLDPRFSVVKHDDDGDMILTPAQEQALAKFEPKKIIEALKQSRQKMDELESSIETLQHYIQLAKKNAKNNKSKAKSNSFGYFNPADELDFDLDDEMISSDVGQLERELEAAELKLEKHEERYSKASALQAQCIMQLDTAALQAFTSRAKALGITPIFDLVLNHLAKDAAFVSANKDLFDFRDRTFPDATTFAYSKLQGKFADKLTDEEKYELGLNITQVFEGFWKPFIQRYIQVYGFHGARVDCVRKVPQALRAKVYELIKDTVSEQADALPCVILEETLFSDLSPKEFAEKVKGAGASHNTGSVYYRQREWHGGLSDDYSQEDYYKKSMVSNGVVNFSGNHDHYTCAMTVCRELAFERLQANKELYASYLEYVKTKESLKDDNSLTDTVLDQIKSQYTHYYVQEILAELNDPDNYNDNINRFGKAFRDKFLTNVFAGSGGYFMLSGDEHASLHQPSIFIRDNDEQVYPHVHLAVFDSTFAKEAEEILNRMAEESILPRKYGKSYQALSTANKKIFLSAVKQQIRNELNANVSRHKNRFEELLEKKLGTAFTVALLEQVAETIDSNNGWSAPPSLARFADADFFKETNEILSKMPPSRPGFWSELFKAVNDDVLIAVRMNGVGYDAQAEVVIQNINPYKTVKIDKTDLEKIALWLQQRGFPNPSVATVQSPEYHKAYGCIMGSQAYQQFPANLYFGGNIQLDKDIMEHSVNIGGINIAISIIVAPKPISPDPLFAQGPVQYVPEVYSEQQLLTMFKAIQVSKKQPEPEAGAKVDEPVATAKPSFSLRKSGEVH
ncbi:MAG: hypothetical protein AB7I18_01390 [Candidatus Berkiella sp.]